MYRSQKSTSNNLASKHSMIAWLLIHIYPFAMIDGHSGCKDLEEWNQGTIPISNFRGLSHSRCAVQRMSTKKAWSPEAKPLPTYPAQVTTPLPKHSFILHQALPHRHALIRGQRGWIPFLTSHSTSHQYSNPFPTTHASFLLTPTQ